MRDPRGIVARGVVVAQHKGDFYDVDVTIGASVHRVICKRAGKLVQMGIRLLPLDAVEVEISPFDTSKGRVIFRGFRKGEG